MVKRGRSIVKILWERQAGRCYYCLELMIRRNGRATHPLHNTIDHFVPKRIIPPEIAGWFYRAGMASNPNMVLACYSCNQEKGDQVPQNWDGRLGPYRLTEDGWILDDQGISIIEIY